MPVWTLLLLFLAALVPPQTTETGLHVWVRDLDDRGVAGVQLQIVDAAAQRRTVLTDAQGVALITPLPGAFAPTIRANAPDGQPLLMDENDPAGGLRIPLEAGVVQPLDLRVGDGLLFVAPVAEPETPPSPPPTVSSAVPAARAVPAASPALNTAMAAVPPPGADPAVPAPADVARTRYRWVRSLVLLVVIGIVAVVVSAQALAILRARRAA